MKLCKPVIDFINLKADDIDLGNFDSVYKDLFTSVYLGTWEPEYTGEFTKALLDADIEPLTNMSYVPAYYLCGDAEFTGHYNPESIHAVEEGAFKDTSLEEIDFGINCRIIDDDVCSGNRNLTTVIWHDKLARIGNELFFGCTDLQEITFKGTVEKWNGIFKEKRWKNGAPNLHYISCTDGEIEI